MQGRLQDMAVADLIQHNCMDGKTASLKIHHHNEEAWLYFDGGEIVHATCEDLTGEAVIFHILNWNDGNFELSSGAKAPTRNITRHWTGILLEGAQRLDESTQESFVLIGEKSPRISPSHSTPKEKSTMAKTRGERLADVLSRLLADSSDIQGAAVVGLDGLVYSANVPQKALDEELVGAVSAAIFGLSRRSAEQLQRGALVRSLIQGTDGNIIVAAINSETLFVGLTANNVNLGMAFMEIRSIMQSLAELL